MVPCLIIGDGIAVGLAQARPVCAAVARKGVTSAAFVASDLSHLTPADTAVISLGGSDTPGMTTGADLQRVRQAITAQRVIWLIPNVSPAVRLAMATLAAQWRDSLIDVRAPSTAPAQAPKATPSAAPMQNGAPAPPAASQTDAEAALMACGSSVEPTTLRAIMRVESGGHDYAINVNGVAMQPPPAATAAEATAVAQAWIARGFSVDMGLMQVNSRNLASLGFSVAQMFDPCTNIQAGASILTADYLAAAPGRPNPQDALKAALSAYNTGSFERGFYNGYVAKYYGPGAQLGNLPIITDAAYRPHRAAPALPPNPFTASPAVFSREASNG